MIARGLMTIEKKRKLEKEEEDESSDDYDVWSGVVNQAELAATCSFAVIAGDGSQKATGAPAEDYG